MTKEEKITIYRELLDEHIKSSRNEHANTDSDKARGIYFGMCIGFEVALKKFNELFDE